LIHYPCSYFEPLEIGRLFDQMQPLEVELGSGDGSFLAQWARQHPERNFLGVERLLGRLRKLDRKGLRFGLANLRLIRIEAGYFMEYLLPAASVAALHIYFPDPWPKRKHHKNRLVNEHFTRCTARVLAIGGMVHLRTDDLEYLMQMTTVFDRSGRFRRLETPLDLLAITTDFERDFQAQGILTRAISYRRNP
jgi:tRNA (guanine-N7-)-methyltransferase